MGLFGRNKEEQDQLAEGLAHTFAATSNQPSASDSEMRKGLDIDIHTIEDEGLTSVLDRLCEGIPYTTKCYDENGKMMVAPVKNDKGEVIRMMPVTENHFRFLPWAPALRAAITKVLPARFIDDYDADTYKIRLRNEFDEILCGMSYEDREAFSPLIHIILLLCETALDDAKGGRKMLALKVSRKELKVGLNRNGKGM